MIKKILILVLALALGLGVGGAAAYGMSRILGGKPLITRPEPPRVFIPTGTVLAPLVFPDGRLAGYAQFEVQIEVSGSQDEKVRQRLPLLLNAINMRSYRTPMASGPDGLIPALDPLRRIVTEAADETFGKGVVSHVAITQATPA